MTITLELSAEAEAKLQESIARKDADGARKVLTDAVAPTVENLLKNGTDQPSAEELRVLLKEIADFVEAHADPNSQRLSDYAVSREGIYEDHP